MSTKALYLYCKKKIWAESPKCSRWKSKEIAQLTVLCRDLKLMSRHEFLLMAHYQSRPLLFLLQPICLAKPLISGRDFEVMSRHDLFSVPSVLMSRPPVDVTTSLSSFSSSVCVATSVLGCDHLAVCMTTSYVSILCRNLMVMLLYGFLFFFLFFFSCCNLSSTLRLTPRSRHQSGVETSLPSAQLFFRLRPYLVVATSPLVPDLKSSCFYVAISE